MKHALVIGGTGMLSGTVKWLIKEGWHVSVTGRTRRKMKQFLKYKEITPIYADYHRTKEMNKKIMQAVDNEGPIELVIAWIHSDAKGALHEVMSEITKRKQHVDLYHIVSGTTKMDELKNEVTAPVNCIYHQVKLGFIKERSIRRWLTHKEISEGVIEAVKKHQRTFIIGALK